MARLKGFQRLTPIGQTLKKLFDAIEIGRKAIVSVDLSSSLNHVLGVDVVAGSDLPFFDRSAVDGYAVKAEDTIGASQFKPKLLKIVENSRVSRGTAKPIWTGNSLPAGANAVVMLENANRLDDRLEVWTPLPSWENVSRKGEDVKKGETVLESGTRLKPQHLGLMAALGMAKAEVFEKPIVAILTTGNELVETGRKLKRDQIYNSNKVIISSLCRELGAEPLDLGVAKDNIDEIEEKIRAILERADLIITTGGTSVGAVDLVPEAVNKIGQPGVIVHGIAMRPGMPTALAVVRGKPLIILSGNPVAAIIGFEVFARPLISRMLGLKQIEPKPTVKAKLTRKVATALGRSTFIRVHVSRKKDEFFAEPVSAKGSGLISTMTKSNGYVAVPENREGLEKEEVVTVSLFDTVRVDE